MTFLNIYKLNVVDIPDDLNIHREKWSEPYIS